MEKNEIIIDTSKIPEYVRQDLLAAAYKATIAYFKQPGVEEEFQKWLAEKKAAKTAKK